MEGQKRQSVDIIAENVQFLGSREDAGNGNGNGYSSGIRAPESDIPADTSDFETRRWLPGCPTTTFRSEATTI